MDKLKLIKFIGATSEITGELPEWIQVCTRGRYNYRGEWVEFDDWRLESMISAFNRTKQDTVIDYEHATLYAWEAPASGWIKELELRDDGLWGKVEWTKKAEGYIRAKEYRYISPVICFGWTDQATGQTMPAYLHSAALTNTPFLPDIQAVAARISMREHMNEKDLQIVMNSLGISSKEEVPEKVRELAAFKDSISELVAGGSLEEIQAQIIELKQQGADRAELQQKLEEQAAELTRRDAAAAVDAAMSQGKVTPAQRKWAMDYALKNPEGFAAFAAGASKQIELTEVAGEETNTETVVCSQDELHYAELLGVTPEQLQQAKSI